MTRRAVFIVNPTSGSYRAGKIADIVRRLELAGIQVETAVTGRAEDAGLFARDACSKEAEPFIIAAGGDGTINGVANGLTPGCATLAILPLGTSNVLAREIGIRSLDDAVSKIIAGRSRPLSVGVLQGEGVSRHFLLMAGAGFDGGVVATVRLGEKKLLGAGAYILAGLRSLCRWDTAPLQVVIDQEQYSCHSVIACNSSKYAGDFRLAPKADIFAPTLEIVCIIGNRRRDLLRLSGTVVCGRNPRGGSVAILSAREVVISGDKAVQIDGDYFCRTPVTIGVKENFLSLVV